MKAFTLTFTDAAASDILEQAGWFEDQVDEQLITRWERSVYLSLFRLARSPRTGALCNFTSPTLRGIRRVPVAGFPKHLIFYRLEDDLLVVLSFFA